MDMKKKGLRKNLVTPASIPMALEEEIITRLLMAHRNKTNIVKEFELEKASSATGGVGARNIEDLTDLLLKGDLSVSKSYLRTLIEDGISIERIYLDLLQPVARKLGVCWENDSLDFATITLAVWHINQLMYYLSPEFLHKELDLEKSRGKIMLFPSIGSQHTLGLFMLAEFFRKASWEVFADPALIEDDIFEILKDEDFQIVGISIGSYDHKKSTKKLISDIRKMFGTSLKIIIGGPLAVYETNLFRELRADGQAADAREAVILANSLVRKSRIPVKS